MDLHEEDNLAEIYRRNRIEEDEFDRFKKRLSTIFIVSIAVILFASAVAFFLFRIRTIDEYFFKHPNTEWECADPYIHISIDENGKPTSYMEINGEMIRVQITNMGNSTNTDISKFVTNGCITIDDQYMNGSAKFRHDRIILEITRDYIFNGKYPEIVLYRVE